MTAHADLAAGGSRPQKSVRMAEIRLFGAPSIIVNGTRARLSAPPRTLPLLALLAVNDGHRIAREAIADALWPELDADAGRAALRRHLLHLERALDRLGVAADFDRGRADLGIRFAPSVLLDVRAFRAAIERNDDAAALELYADHLLATLHEDWIIRDRGQLAALATGALERELGAGRARGDADAVLLLLDRGLALEPWREDLVCEVMQRRFDAGDRAGALLTFGRFASRLADELQTEPLPQTRALYEGLARTTPPRRPRLISADTTSFVGRAAELATVAQALDSHRIVTLVGPPGVGKTRLAKRTAELVANEPRYRDGVVLVDLAPVGRPERLEIEIASAIARGPGTASTDLDELVRDRALLIVLDNCERLHAACAASIESLTHAHPMLAILATSRRTLGARGETVIRINPLPVPAHGAPPVELETSDAIRLFTERARSARADAPLSATAAAAICRRLDGLPLALELAAARLGSVSIEQLDTMLDEQFRLLEAAGREHPHQRALLATYDWSFALLGTSERECFSRLAVFNGGWTLEAAAAVAYTTPVDVWSALDDIGSLVDQSLIVPPDIEGPSRRYRMLDSIRAYALRHLEDSGAADDARATHARYFADRYIALADELRGPTAHRLFPLVEADEANLGAAFATLIDAGRDPQTGMRLALALSRYWTDRGKAASESIWLRRALDFPGGPAAVRADALQCLGTITRNLGDYAQSHALFAHNLAELQRFGTATAIAKAMVTMSNAARMIGRFDEALEFAHEARRRFADSGDAYLAAFASTAAAVAHLSRGAIAPAVTAFSDAHVQFASLGADADAALATLNLGLCAYYSGDHDDAKSLCARGLERALEIENRYVAAHGLQNLAAIEIARRDAASAANFMAPALAAAQQTGDRELMISALETYAAYEVWFGSATRAALAAASADNARTKYHAIRFPIDERAWRLVRERISVVDPRVARVDELEVAAQSLEAALARARAALDTSHSVAPASDPVFS